MEKLEILEILNDWNYWNKPFPLTFERKLYDDKISSFLEKDEVTVIKGIRRCGKSTLMINQMKRVAEKGIQLKNILFVNLEDPRFINHLSIELLQKIKDVYLEYLSPSQKPYIFLDEIQNIENWEKWVNKEYELKLSHITISGSNSSMLSHEIATALSGRYLGIEIFPLSFGEFLGFKNIAIASKLDIVDKKIELSRAFEEFIRYGGFPKVLEYPMQEKNELLGTYKDSILLRDIVARYKLKNFTTLEEIAAFLLSNTSLAQSTTKLKNNFKISFDMANDYVEYLKNAYMIFEVKKFDYSLKKQNLNDRKYYSADLGLSNLFRVSNTTHRGDDLETIVCLELLRSGFEIHYYKTSLNYEVDFVVQKNNQIVELIQVTKTLKDTKTYQREVSAFGKAIEELGLKNVICTIVTEDTSRIIEENGSKITVINIFEFMKK